VTTVAVAATLTANTTITSIGFDYRYLSGYSPTSAFPSNFTVLVAGVAIYHSP
jgi:hypothetical protein